MIYTANSFSLLNKSSSSFINVVRQRVESFQNVWAEFYKTLTNGNPRFNSYQQSMHYDK